MSPAPIVPFPGGKVASHPPAIGELCSPDERISAHAWECAYPLLWEAALNLLTSVLLTGPNHAHDREDIAAQALGQVVHGLIEGRLESFGRIASFDDLKSMMLRVVRTRVIDFFRRQGRRPEDLTDEIPEGDGNDQSGAKSVAEISREEFDGLLAALPPPQPEIFHDHYMLGHTAAEIAEARGIPRGTVLSHLHRGKQILRGRLALLFAGMDTPQPDSFSPVT